MRLGDQDRSLWDSALIEEGHALVRACLRRDMPGPYQIQAAIAAVHADASTAEATDWSQIVQLYDQLLLYTPTPIVALNRAIAVAELDGPAPALAILDQLDLDNFHLYHAARADLLRTSRSVRRCTASPTTGRSTSQPMPWSRTTYVAVVPSCRPAEFASDSRDCVSRWCGPCSGAGR